MDGALGQTASLEGQSASGGCRPSLPSLEGRPPCRPSLMPVHTDGTRNAGDEDAEAGLSKPVPPIRCSETATHLELKRLALLWAQENCYPIVALEVSLPQGRYRADVV